jgi:hypothetical protein
MKKLGLALSILALMCGCNNRPPSPLIEVSVAPALPPSIDQGQTMQFSASLVSNASTPSNSAVAWSLSGPGCAGATCGTLSNLGGASTTYTAPKTVSASLSVTVTATSTVQPLQSGSSTFTVFPPPSIVTTNLAAATPTYIYHTTFEASGGVQPLNWSLAGGTLPAGMTLNSAGILFGTPTVGGTSTFTVRVTDSSTAPSGPLSTQQTFSLTVLNTLTVPPATLPNGTVGIAYSAALPSSGGVPPLAWTIYSGSLPSGLILQKTGTITGTPTTQGTFTFEVTVVDSSPVQQMFTSTNFTITINPSGPLALRTTSLVDGTVDVPYRGQLVATGGTPPLVWTLTGGALPTGLALGPTTGAISGTPTAAPGTYTYNVQVADTSSPPETSGQQLSITINPAAAACSSTGSNSLLVGQYAFSLRGYNGVGYLAVVGSFTADGAGNITAGEADTNGVLGAQTGNLITSASSYSVGPDNRGCATIATPFGTFFTRFAMGGVSAGVATAGRIIEFDTPGASAYIAAGQLMQQTPSAFLFPITGSYDLLTSGWDPSTSGRIACVGMVTGNRNAFSYLQQDCNDNGAVTNTINVSTSANTQVNTYSAADTNGRGTGIISVGQGTSDFTFYWVSTTQLLVVNSDPAPTFSGNWQQQNVPVASTAFNQGSFDGQVAFYSSGIGPSGAGGDASIGIENANGATSVTSNIYRDLAGAVQTLNTTCTYTVVGIGRVTLTGSACGANPPIAWLNTLNSAFVLGTGPTIELGAFEPQALGLSISSLAGTYYLGTSEVVSQSDQAEVGILTVASNGVVTGALDSATTSAQTAGVAVSDTYTLNSNGTVTAASSGGATVGVAISGNKFVIVNDPTMTFPTLLIDQR